MNLLYKNPYNEFEVKSGGPMNHANEIETKKHGIGRKVTYIICTLFILSLVFGGYFFSEKYFANESSSTQAELGAKVTITLPNGKKVFTYENLIVQEDGKLLYKGDRNTIDLTGGVMVYEDWKN